MNDQLVGVAQTRWNDTPTRRYSFAWKRAIAAVGWWQPVLGLLGMVVIGVLATARDPIIQSIGYSAIAGIGALVGGVQAALAFAPADEPALELTLSAPRPLYFLLGERLIVILVMNAVIAGIGALIFTLVVPTSSIVDQLMRWFPAFVAMVGIGLTIGLVSKRANFGALLIILLVGAMLFGGAEVLIHYFEWAWAIHLFLPPMGYSAEQLLINRVVLLSLGTGLMGYSFLLLRDTEKLLQTLNS